MTGRSPHDRPEAWTNVLAGEGRVSGGPVSGGRIAAGTGRTVSASRASRRGGTGAPASWQPRSASCSARQAAALRVSRPGEVGPGSSSGDGGRDAVAADQVRRVGAAAHSPESAEPVRVSQATSSASVLPALPPVTNISRGLTFSHGAVLSCGGDPVQPYSSAWMIARTNGMSSQASVREAPHRSVASPGRCRRAAVSDAAAEPGNALRMCTSRNPSIADRLIHCASPGTDWCEVAVSTTGTGEERERLPGRSILKRRVGAGVALVPVPYGGPLVSGTGERVGEVAACGARARVAHSVDEPVGGRTRRRRRRAGARPAAEAEGDQRHHAARDDECRERGHDDASVPLGEAHSSAGSARANPRTPAPGTSMRESRPSAGAPPRRRRRRRRASRRRAARASATRAGRGASVSSSVTSRWASSTMRRTSLVDELLGRRRGLAGAGQEQPLRLAREHRDRPDRLAHAPAADHLAGDRGELLDVGLGAGRDRAVDDLLGDAAAERDLDLRLRAPRASRRRGRCRASRASRRAPSRAG